MRRQIYCTNKILDCLVNVVYSSEAIIFVTMGYPQFIYTLVSSDPSFRPFPLTRSLSTSAPLGWSAYTTASLIVESHRSSKFCSVLI
ncbi:hypothetical protein AG1IA_10341 [Rhizoctonia solani AG-1 IA]|uniref:Uncharacterized protein n=1 Tax=Thanatephorus cucumeris (strain AG1-IA) TaxID=983506 RepID=L8WGW2_THACA|nr:hypothetical protein AG1IA_10341 [Rhizoctonia solani AG-1 IA]